MFSSSRSLLFTLFNFLALFTALALAAPLSRQHVHLGSLSKRYGNARFTYYDAGENACGFTDSDTAYVIALSSALFNNGAHCRKNVTIQYGGQEVQATVTDECPGCNNADADLSRPLFARLAPLDEGVIHGNWWFN